MEYGKLIHEVKISLPKAPALNLVVACCQVGLCRHSECHDVLALPVGGLVALQAKRKSGPDRKKSGTMLFKGRKVFARWSSIRRVLRLRVMDEKTFLNPFS